MRRPAVVALALVAAAHLPALGGGWVWDDHYLVEQNPLIGDLPRLLASDLFSPSGQGPSDAWRPLAMLTHWAVQAVAPGPLAEHIVNLGLHLAAVALVAGLARAAGAPAAAAWLGAAAFGAHTGASEAVDWVSGRHELLAAVLLLGALRALPRRPLLAGALAALAPFAKEPYLAAPLALAVAAAAWRGPGRRRLALAPLVALLGPFGVFAGRAAVRLPLPTRAAAREPLAGLGALALRFVELVALPAHADALPPYAPAPLAGLLALAAVGALSLFSALRRRPGLAPLAAGGLVALPAGPAVAWSGLASDRYLYLLFAGAGVALALGWAALLRARRPRLDGLAWLVPAALAASTAVRAGDWRSDEALFSASLARRPDAPRAAFHLGHALHAWGGDCAAAIPLYRRAVEVEPRARTNLVACLVETGRLEEAIAEGPRLDALGPDGPKVPASLARALALSGRLDEARSWAERAVERGPRPADLVLLGNICGMAGDLRCARTAFERALSLAPDAPGAREGLEAVERAEREAAP